MPKYNYKCKVCENIFVERHAVHSPPQGCPECSAEELQKLPSGFKIINKIGEQDHKPGDVVKRSIEEVREEVKMEKQKLKNKLWNDNE